MLRKAVSLFPLAILLAITTASAQAETITAAQFETPITNPNARGRL